MCADWKDYASEKPASAGTFEWKVPSRVCDGMDVRVYANNRLRGAGYEQVVSPAFDYWDGYRVHVPKGTMWREAPEDISLKNHEQVVVCIDGLDVDPCPFCGNVPKFKGYQQSKYGGYVIGPAPQNLNDWQLHCCRWAQTPSYEDPRQLVEARKALLAKARGAS